MLSVDNKSQYIVSNQLMTQNLDTFWQAAIALNNPVVELRLRSLRNCKCTCISLASTNLAAIRMENVREKEKLCDQFRFC